MDYKVFLTCIFKWQTQDIMWPNCPAGSKINSCQPPNVGRISVWQVLESYAPQWWINVCTKIVMPKCVLVLFMGVCFCPLLSVLAFDAHPLTYTTICVFTHWPPCVLLVLHHSLLYRISACSSLSCSCWSTGSPHKFTLQFTLHSTHKWCVSCRGTSVPLLHYHRREKNFISCKHNSPPFTYQYVFVEFFLHGTNLVQKPSKNSALKVVNLLFWPVKK